MSGYPDIQSWDDEWKERTLPPQPNRRPTIWSRLTHLALWLGTLYLFTVIIAAVLYIAVGQSMLRNWYLDLEPFDQEVWCNRFEKYLDSSYLCDVRAEQVRNRVPLSPTLSATSAISPEELLLTPLFDPTDATTDAVGPDDLSLTPPFDPSGAGGGADQSSLTVTPSPMAFPTNTPLANEPTATETPLPTLPTTATLIPTQAPTPTVIPPPSSARLELERLTPEAQWWNNCGPTTLTMGLSYYGYPHNQGPAAEFLKPNREDKNVSPWQMTRYVNEIATNTVNVRAISRIGGTQTLLKSLLANGYPVIVEKGYDVNNLDWMGHYLLLVGYDDTTQTFLTFDSYLGTNSGQGRTESYSQLNTFWQHFNYALIVLYEPWQEQHLMQVLGNYADENYAITSALEIARTAASTNSTDKWAWFNMGDAYTRLGRYEEAASAFDQAFSMQMPWRTLWYRFTPFEAYYRVGRYQDVLSNAQYLDNMSEQYVEEAWYWRGMAYAAQGQYDQAITQFERVLRFNENFTPAGEAISAIRTGTFVPPV